MFLGGCDNATKPPSALRDSANSKIHRPIWPDLTPKSGADIRFI
jgi:hypothetical protein